jgi:hypothetical protein
MEVSVRCSSIREKISSSIMPTLHGMAATQPQELPQDLRSGLQDAEDNLF